MKFKTKGKIEPQQIQPSPLASRRYGRLEGKEAPLATMNEKRRLCRRLVVWEVNYEVFDL